MGFPGGSDGKESACNAADPGLIPESRRSPGEGNGNPLQYSCLENSMDGGTWWATVHGVAKSWTRLSNQHFHFQKRKVPLLAPTVQFVGPSAKGNMKFLIQNWLKISRWWEHNIKPSTGLGVTVASLAGLSAPSRGPRGLLWPLLTLLGAAWLPAFLLDILQSETSKEQ